MKRPTLTPTTWVALALVGIAAIGVVAWFTISALNAWAPNVTVGALSIAITITVVERAIRSEARSWIRPRVETVIWAIDDGLRDLLLAIVFDYAGTHINTFLPIQTDGIEIIELWLSEQNTEDAPRLSRAEKGMPSDELLLHEARDLAQSLERLRTRDVDVIAPALVRAIDDFVGGVHAAGYLLDFAERHQADSVNGERRGSLRTVVKATQDFALALWRDGGHRMTISEQTRSKSRGMA